MHASLPASRVCLPPVHASLIPSHSHSLTHLLIRPFIHFLPYFIHLFIHSLTHSLTHSLIHSFIHSFIHSLTQSVSAWWVSGVGVSVSQAIQTDRQTDRQTEIDRLIIRHTHTHIYIHTYINIDFMQIWRLIISINWILSTKEMPDCHTFVSYFQVYVFGTRGKRGCTTNFDILFLVMGFISLVDEMQFMLISSCHICIRSISQKLSQSVSQSAS